MSRRYNETDEETFRPSLSETPADPSEAMLLVRATFELQDGSRHDGFVTPSVTPDLGLQQPHIWVGERCFGFWGGLFGVPPEERQAFYAAIGKPPEAVFPLRFSVDAALASGESSGLFHGFYRHSGGDASPSIET
jgi:hypothetical protein